MSLDWQVWKMSDSEGSMYSDDESGGAGSGAESGVSQVQSVLSFYTAFCYLDMILMDLPQDVFLIFSLVLYFLGQ